MIQLSNSTCSIDAITDMGARRFAGSICHICIITMCVTRRGAGLQAVSGLAIRTVQTWMLCQKETGSVGSVRRPVMLTQKAIAQQQPQQASHTTCLHLHLMLPIATLFLWLLHRCTLHASACDKSGLYEKLL